MALGRTGARRKRRFMHLLELRVVLQLMRLRDACAMQLQTTYLLRVLDVL